MAKGRIVTKWRNRAQKILRSPMVSRVAQMAAEERHTGYAMAGAGAMGYLKSASPDTWEKLSVGGVEPPWVLFLAFQVAGRAMKSRTLREVGTGMGCVAAFSLGENLGKD